MIIRFGIVLADGGEPIEDGAVVVEGKESQVSHAFDDVERLIRSPRRSRRAHFAAG